MQVVFLIAYIVALSLAGARSLPPVPSGGWVQESYAGAEDEVKTANFALAS